MSGYPMAADDAPFLDHTERRRYLLHDIGRWILMAAVDVVIELARLAVLMVLFVPHRFLRPLAAIAILCGIVQSNAYSAHQHPYMAAAWLLLVVGAGIALVFLPRVYFWLQTARRAR